MIFNDFFDKIFCINLDRRTDRWANCLNEFTTFGITNYERIAGFPHKNGNAGCTRSHHALLRRIVQSDYQRVLVLEDDFRIIHPDFHAKFEEQIKYVPDDWDMLYIGGHYACKPLSRVNEHVIKVDKMHTTSSFGITKKFATTLLGLMDEAAKSCCGKENPSEETLLEVYLGPIDAVYSNWLSQHNVYIFQPRLMVQRPGYSDLTEQENNNEHCMLDTSHENMV